MLIVSTRVAVGGYFDMPAAPFIIALVAPLALLVPVNASAQPAPESSCNTLCQWWVGLQNKEPTGPQEQASTEPGSPSELGATTSDVEPRPDAAAPNPAPATPIRRHYSRHAGVGRAKPQSTKAAGLTSLDILRMRTAPSTGAAALSPKAE